jgi:hypothetical protein
MDARYDALTSTVINSRAELLQLISATGQSTRSGPLDASDPLIGSLLAADIDYENEALVLLRQTSGGGGVRVSLDPPELQGKTFIATLRTTETNGFGATVMSYHFYAFAVSRARVDDVRVVTTPFPVGDGVLLLTVPD